MTLEELIEKEWLDDLARLRSLGWSVAVHNDYVQGGQRMTFWLFTNTETGKFAKGEGRTDALAVYAALCASGIDDDLAPSFCSRCREHTRPKSGGSTCEGCSVSFAKGRWWRFSCDGNHYGSHGLGCLDEVSPASGGETSTDGPKVCRTCGRVCGGAAYAMPVDGDEWRRWRDHVPPFDKVDVCRLPGCNCLGPLCPVGKICMRSFDSEDWAAARAAELRDSGEDGRVRIGMEGGAATVVRSDGTVERMPSVFDPSGPQSSCCVGAFLEWLSKARADRDAVFPLRYSCTCGRSWQIDGRDSDHPRPDERTPRASVVADVVTVRCPKCQYVGSMMLPGPALGGGSKR